MLHVLTWWLALQLFGLAALPIVARFFGRLPDRGVAFARPVGLLAVAYLLWMGNVVGVLGNTTATVVVLLVALGAAGWLGLPAAVAHLRAFWREHRRVAVVHELVFLGAFVIWAIVRAYQPDIMATEKPMEFGFLNSSMRSPVLPPNDPWLAGYSISYYYLGYVVIAIVARLAAVPPSVAFNLGIATLFALTVTGAFSLGYNLVRGGRGGDAGNGRAYVGGALTVLFVTFLANLEGFVEWLRLRNLVSGQFLAWLQIKDLTPLEPERLAQLQTWYPTDAFDNWWWFRASRVVGTYVGSQARDYTINEFPFFSFILGDMHPHVLTLPFAFVVLGFALNLLRTEQPIEARSLRDRPLDLLFIGFLFGSLSFLNAWDMLTYLFILAAAFAIHAYLSRPALDRRWLKQVAIFAGLALAASLVLYWPFYVTFRSQTQGIGIVGVTGARGLRTQLQHFVVFWGPLVFFAASYVVAQLARGNPRRVHLDPSCPWPADTSAPKPQPDWTRQPFTWILTGALGVALFVANAPALGVVVPLLIGSLATLWRGLLAEVAAGQPIRVPVLAGRSPLPQPGTGFRNGTEGEGSVRQGGPAEIAGGAGAMVVAREPLFVLVLIGTGALLLLGTELVFIRDFFNDRMNTVFKLFYQTWVLFAVAAAYAVVALADRVSRLHQAHQDERADTGFVPTVGLVGADAWGVAAAAIALMALVYTPMALLARTEGFARTPTLDGLAYQSRFRPDDAEAIRWLQANVAGSPVILEAPGGSYSQFGRVSANTGLPTVLGWDFHERQWRGTAVDEEMNRRKADVDAMYRSTDVGQVRRLLQKYRVAYVYVGALEREQYGRQDPALLNRLRSFLDVAYDRNGVTILRVVN